MCRNSFHGVMCMARTNIVIFTGAGFSVPANLPIQNKIIAEMAKSPLDSIMDVAGKESEEFLFSFIRVICYLLQAYAKDDYSALSEELRKLENSHIRGNAIAEVSDVLWRKLSDYGDDSSETDHIINSVRRILNEQSFSAATFYTELFLLKEKTRTALKESNLRISLEDVFTVFDKSMQQRERRIGFTHLEMDNIRQALVRLFAHYFGEQEYRFDPLTSTAYDSFFSYVNRHLGDLSIISTNWDTVLERSFRAKSINYSLSLNDCYYHFDDNSKNRCNKNKRTPSMKLSKLHGSVNWFRCSNCGCIIIVEKEPYTDYLLQDNRVKCLACGQASENGSSLLHTEIITPTMIKSIDSQIYRNIWKSASETLTRAEKIIFLGYSLPISDFELRYLLFKSINVDAKIDVVLYHNDDPAKIPPEASYLYDLLPEKRYYELFPKNKISYYYEGFCKYFDEIRS